MAISLVLQVLPEYADAEELNELGEDLGQAIIETDPEGIKLAPPSDAALAFPALAQRSIDPATLGIIVFGLVSSKLIPSVLKVVETWISGRRCSVEVQVGVNPHIRISGGSPAFQSQEIARFLDQIASDDNANQD